MTYEPGVLVRRQQREYPPELRREIATMALEVGNNREVARLYSERLGYTVNESTVRGIKKRYLEGVQKGKIDSPGLSPRSGNESSNQGDRDSDTEGDSIIQPENCMRLQLDVLEGKMKDRGSLEADEEADIDHHDMEDASTLVISESALSINGEDSRDSCNQLSIDTGETDQDLVQTAAITKPSIRIAKGLTRDNNENHAPVGMGGILAATLQSGTKRKQSNGGPLVSPMFSNGGLVSPPQGPVVKKQRPNSSDNDQEIVSLEKEVRALQWLARRKEKEWDQVISLLKQKEEKLIKAQRTRVLIQAEAEHLLSKHKPVPMSASPQQPLASPATMVLPGSATMAPVIVPQQQVLILPSSVTMTSSPLNTVNTNTARLIQPKPPMTVKPVTQAPVMTNLVTKTVTSSASVGVTLRSKSPGAAQKQTNGGALTTEQSPEQKIAVSTTVTAERAAKNLQKAASGGNSTPAKEEVKKSTPDCQGCGKKKSEFVCAGCSNRWYCSRECQVEDWDEHADECSG